MAIIRFSGDTMNNQRPDVVMILKHYQREYKATISIIEQEPSGATSFKIKCKELPNKQMDIVFIDLVPGVVIIKEDFSYAR